MMIMKWGLFLILGLIEMSSLIAQPRSTISVSNDIQLIQLRDSIFIHTSWFQSKDFGRVSANGLIIIKDGQAVMTDTPWDNEMTKQLTEFIEDSLHASIVKLIAGHYHEDCIGGLEYIQSRGIESIANFMTIAYCKENKHPIPSTSFSDSLIINFNGIRLDCHYFGGGHTFDNIIVGIPEKQILFGGCLVKSSDSENLGYIGEAVINDWGSTIKKVMRNYTNIEVIVPGHGNYGGTELLTHTIDLVEKTKKK